MNVQEELLAIPGIGGSCGIHVDKMFTFHVKSFFVMGKALSGQLSCTWTGLVLFAFLAL